MSILDNFFNYIDGNGLYASKPGTWSPGQSGSDNGCLFTSEVYILLNKNGQLTDQDKIDWANKINQCIGSDLLNRVPVDQDSSQEAPDDYYGVLNAAIELGNTNIPRKLLWGCIKYKGSLDNVNPGTWQWSDFLIRQPALFCCFINSSFPSLKNPLHWLVRLICFPLYFISGIAIAISNIGQDVSDSTDRILAWHTQNNLKKTSLFCWLASLIWFWRLRKEYANGMKDITGIYFKPSGLNQNPYSKYWVD